MPDRWNGWFVLVGVLLVSFVLNYIWEIAQMPAFLDGMTRPFRTGLRFSAIHCFVPTLGDIVVAGVTYLIGWTIHGTSGWIQHLGWRDVALVSVVLILLATNIELVNVYVLQQWAYSELMPIVPIIRIGLLPMVQLALLTLLTFRIVGQLMNWRQARQVKAQ